MLNAALVTVASGADNIGVYIPLFAGFAVRQIALAVCVFLILTALWCWMGKKLAGLSFLRRALVRWKKVVVLAVYLVLGGYILIRNLLWGNRRASPCHARGRLRIDSNVALKQIKAFSQLLYGQTRADAV